MTMIHIAESNKALVVLVVVEMEHGVNVITSVLSLELNCSN